MGATQFVEFPVKELPILTSNSIPVIGVMTTDWDRVSGEDIVNQIDAGKSLILKLGGQRELRRAGQRKTAIYYEILRKVENHTEKEALMRINLPEYEALRNFQPTFAQYGIELVPGISSELAKSLVANPVRFSDAGAVGMITFFLDMFFEKRKTPAFAEGKVIVDLINFSL